MDIDSNILIAQNSSKLKFINDDTIFDTHETVTLHLFFRSPLVFIFDKLTYSSILADQGALCLHIVLNYIYISLIIFYSGFIFFIVYVIHK
ncbi:hypothetical protein Glove_590g47 [Diversispora epigaea]|uniref:Uncharacterized protein n=1 Tax=Diversispora epigaea TaxID=1348612 RepID=A0A397GGB8_9GLOM|nr:hypothetical protein Glove_590g47 [Diversispora epigaea]